MPNCYGVKTEQLIGEILITINRESSDSLSDQVCDGLLKHIGSRLHVRDRLPSVRQLSSQLGVSAWTVNEAYQRLMARGVITSHPGLGYFVAKSAPHPAPARIAHYPKVRPMNAVSFVRNAVDPSSHAVSAGTGFLPRAWIDNAIPAAVMRKVLCDPAITVPAPAHGLLEFRNQLITKLSLANINVSPDQIVTTYGVTHAVRLICQQVLRPGDRVVIEDPSYMVQQTQLRDLGAELLAVPRRHDGPDLEVLECIVQEFRPRIVFTQCTLHNPTGTTSSPANCYGLLSLAEKYDFLIIEDDVFGDLAPESALRLAALDTFRRVFYVGSFTKVLSPAVRVGFLIGPPAHIDGILEQKILSVLTGSSLLEAIVSHTLKSGSYGAHINSLRRKLTKAHNASRIALSQAGVVFGPGASDGLFLWGELPSTIEVDRLLRQAFHEGILLTKGSMFSPTGSFEHYLRFNVAHASDPKLLGFLQQFTQSLSSLRDE
jgi:DNA-binding transcriptional MocR family regulator